jgi:DNA-binding NtrC family response regulator
MATQGNLWRIEEGIIVKKHILIVDDQTLILFSLADILKSGSVEVATASTALKALEIVTAFPCYDLCLIDLGLPDMNGVELIKEIKKISPASRFIIMTGRYYSERDLFENMKEAVDIGPCRLITKPFDFDEAMEIIFQVLAEEQPG